MDVIPYRIDVDELLTVQSFGVAVPILLVFVALDTELVHFLCLIGFSPGLEKQIALDFGFDHTDEGRMHTAIVADLPRWLGQFDHHSAPTFDTLLALSADNTAATETQFNVALKRLKVDREIEILTPRGSQKRLDARIRAQHRIRLARQGKLF